MKRTPRTPDRPGPEDAARQDRPVTGASQLPEPLKHATEADPQGERIPSDGTLWHSYAREAGDGDLAELSDSEAAVFRVVADPAFVNATAQQRADAAGISRRTYFRVLADPHFEPKFRAAWRRCLRAYVGPVLSALVTSASTPEPRHSSDRKLFLEMVGLGEPQQDETTQANGHEQMTDAELVQSCIDAGIPIPPGIRRRLSNAGIALPDDAALRTEYLER